ncbi:MAG: Rne/Rng family ribonuclease [Allobranchiibius sp.]
MSPQDDQTSIDQAPAAPVAVPAFGLLFQAPDTTARAPRVSRAPEPAAPIDDNGPTRGRSEGPRADAGPVSRGSDDGNDDADDSRPRRRGGRGRKAKPDAETDSGSQGDGNTGEGKHDAGSDAADSDNDSNTDNTNGSQRGRKGSKQQPRSQGSATDRSEDSDDSTSGDDGTDQELKDDGDGRRRTRRRRRGTAGGAAGEVNDPPGTVTKVREPRTARDEVTSIKGSTRLEAKKQRRREGREAGRRRTVITEAEFLARRESVDRVMVVRELEGRTQIGVLEDGVLVEHYVSRESQQSSMAGNIYLGRVQNVLPSMEAAFVDVGRGRNAVLYAGEVNWDAAGLDNGQAKRIENALKSGESVLAQVTKDPIGHKGARLTSQISLPGRFLVYVPGHAMTGISRKLPDTERARLKKILKEVVPADAGVIVRTAAEGASEADLKADVERLQATWEKIQRDVRSGQSPSLLHGEPDLALRVIRDVFNEDFAKLIISGETAWNQVEGYLQAVAPDLAGRLEKWTGDLDLFTVHRVDEQLSKAMDRKVWLPSGGSLVIDRTEAMTVIDVNTGKFVGSGGNLEETVTKNNIEAAEEIVRQLRLRDIGGIIVVDFIDMVLESNRDLVVRRMLECLGRDRTKHQVAEVTSLGLVQMTRKRVGSGLIEVFSEECTACGGRGLIVHDQPVDKSVNQSDGNYNSGSGSGSSGRGRRGKSRTENGGSSNGSNSNAGNDVAVSTPASTPTGPSAAQIAAAAHAAAVTAGEKARDTSYEAIESVHDAIRRAGSAAGPAPQAEPAPEQPSTFTASDMADSGQQQISAEEPASPPVSVTPARRKRKRVIAPAGPPSGGDVPQSSFTPDSAAQTADLEAANTDQ